MEEEIKDIIEILELAKEEIENNNENITATLDLQDLKSLKNLYDLYNKEKEKNEKLKEENKELRKPKYIIDCKTNKVTKLTNDFVSKDKIREIIGELEKQEDWYAENKSLDDLYGKIDILQELLQEGDDK